ncbi:MAG: pilus assembly protein [Propionibacterium sp.]|nr:pilus assembly protein [Propionibacterium sp.]
MRTRSPHLKPADDERGSISLWAALAALCMIVIVGIAVDFGGQAVAEQQARSVAFEAARTGGQQVNLDQLVRGQQAQTDPYKAAAAANAYLADAGVVGSVTVNSDTVTVTITSSYQCSFLSIIGINSLPVTGTASADTLRVYEGTQR